VTLLVGRGLSNHGLLAHQKLTRDDSSQEKSQAKRGVSTQPRNLLQEATTNEKIFAPAFRIDYPCFSIASRNKTNSYSNPKQQKAKDWKGGDKSWQKI
jgi:hypothetical protein